MATSATELAHTVKVRLYPTPEQAALLHTHGREHILTVNVLACALDAGMLDDHASTASFTAPLPSAIKNQALREARSVYQKAQDLGRLPVLKKPHCDWNNQNWVMQDGMLNLPVWTANSKHVDKPDAPAYATQQIAIPCASVALPEGKKGILRIKRVRQHWIASVTITLPTPEPTQDTGVMGIDLGVKNPAVVQVVGKGNRFFGNGRYQRMMRRRFFTHRQDLQKAHKPRAVHKSQGKEQRWMQAINHQLSHAIVEHAQQQGVGVIRMEQLTGIRQRTTGKSRKNNRMIATWSFGQLATFIEYKARRKGMRVEWVDPAYTSQECPECHCLNEASDRRYVCKQCGWRGHRDAVGAISISRRTGVADKRQRATGAKGSAGGRVA